MPVWHDVQVFSPGAPVSRGSAPDEFPNSIIGMTTHPVMSEKTIDLFNDIA